MGSITIATTTAAAVLGAASSRTVCSSHGGASWPEASGCGCSGRGTSRGELTRTQSIAREGRTAATVWRRAGLRADRGGLIEAFVTPPGCHLGPVGIGITAELAFFVYVFVVGRAYRRGATGDIDGLDAAEDRVATQA